MRAIIIYATCEGQSERIANRIAHTMTNNGVPADTLNVTRQNVLEVAVESYDAVVLGSSLHYAKHDPRIGWCLREYRQLLNEIPSAFFSVSLGIASKREQDRNEAEWLANKFLRHERFEPARRACFAGALRYSKYGWLMKRMMHWIAQKGGQKTATDRDYEYTDWDAVDAFAIDFAELVLKCQKVQQWGALSPGDHTGHLKCPLNQPGPRALQNVR